MANLTKHLNLLEYLESDHLGEFQDMTCTEIVNKFSEIAFRDKFEALRAMDQFHFKLKQEVLAKTAVIKDTKTECECGATIVMRHYDRHCRGSRHQKYVQDQQN